MITVDYIAEGFVRKENDHDLPKFGDIVKLPERLKDIETGERVTVLFQYKVAQIEVRCIQYGWYHYNIFCNRVLPDGSVREVYPPDPFIRRY